MHEPLCPAARRGIEGMRGAEDVRPPDLIGPLEPERHGRRRVDDELAAGGVVLPGTRLTDITADDVPGWVSDEVGAAHLVAIGQVALEQGPSDEARGPGDEDAHGRNPSRVAPLRTLGQLTSRSLPSWTS